jgi:Tfp pilus assembly protein PilN
MRPVNLIPPDQRTGDSAPLRTGSLIYVLVGGLALLLLGIVAVALTGKQINDREAQKASLQQELTQASAEAQSVQAFTSFRAVQENRAATVASLAQSRFDWDRVLNELARVLPSDVSLTTLTGTVSPDVQLQESGGSSGTDLRSDVSGPALQIKGCAPSQDAVAGFVASLEDIDGVTRVGVSSSKLPDENQTDAATGGTTDAGPAGTTAAAAAGGEGDCPPEVYTFEIVAAFDAVATPSTATVAPSVPPAAVPPTGSDAQQVADVQTQENVQRASVREQTAKSQQAAHNLVPGS